MGLLDFEEEVRVLLENFELHKHLYQLQMKIFKALSGLYESGFWLGQLVHAMR